MDRDTARLARARQQEERLLAEHEYRRLLQKMRGHNRRAGRERPRALGEGRDTGAGVGHARAPPSSQEGRMQGAGPAQWLPRSAGREG